MAYTPDPTNVAQPTDNVFASTAAAEFRALKAYIATIVAGGGPGAQTPGMIAAFAYNSAPPGWLILDGSLVSRTTYAALWALVNSIGALISEAAWVINAQSYSTGDLATTFRLPDYRGVFMRGADQGRGVDPGRVIGTGQNDCFQDHGHQVYTINVGGTGPYRNFSSFGVTLAAVAESEGPSSAFENASLAGLGVIPNTGGSPRTGQETRPVNGAVIFCVKT